MKVVIILKYKCHYSGMLLDESWKYCIKNAIANKFKLCDKYRGLFFIRGLIYCIYSVNEIMTLLTINNLHNIFNYFGHENALKIK